MYVKLLLLLTILVIFYPLTSYSVMSSTHYTILGDQMGMGADMSQGGNYVLRDSSGALITAGVIDNDTYEIRSGFYFVDSGVLSIEVSSSSLDLGALSSGVVKTAETTITISTDSETGYTLRVGSVSSGGLADVSDGQVTAGSEEFGFIGSGIHCLLSNSSTAVIANTPIASFGSKVSFSQTNLIFQAAISASTAAVSSAQKTISLIASANF